MYGSVVRPVNTIDMMSIYTVGYRYNDITQKILNVNVANIN
jgi:hypothetical protein